MQTIFSTKNVQIRRLEAGDTFQNYATYKKRTSARQRAAVREIAKNGALTALSLRWIFADLKSPVRSCKEELGQLCQNGILARLEIWHGDTRSGIAYAISTEFKRLAGNEVSALQYLPQKGTLQNKKSNMMSIARVQVEKIIQYQQERDLDAEEQMEWLSIASLVAGARRISYKTDQLFPVARIRNGLQAPSYVVISCRKGQELLPRLVFLTDQMAGRKEWRGIIVFESFREMQQQMELVLKQLGRLQVPVYGTYDRACIESQMLYEIEYIPDEGAAFTPHRLQTKRQAWKPLITQGK